MHGSGRPMAGALDPPVTIVAVDPGVCAVAADALPPRSDLVLEPLALTMSAGEAVAVYRRLAGANPAAYEPDLAASLTNLSAVLVDAGRHDDALATIEEAVAVYRRLAAADPAVYEADLATALNNLSAEVVRRQQALLASLDNVWDMLALAAQSQEALDPIEEAVAIYRRLAAANPAAYQSDLAASLNNLSDNFDWAGRRDKALAAEEEAVAVYRRLAAANPAAHELNLNVSLNKLSVLKQPAKLSFATSMVIVLVLMEIAKICLGIAMLAVQVFTFWQELKGQPLG